MTNYLKLPLDKTKRHFVFGDIHGRVGGLIELLKEINYNPDTDILYAVGDLIDRGPHSVDCLEYFIDAENRYTVMGNHEYMVIDQEWHNTWLYNGGFQTIDSLQNNMRDQDWLKNKVRDLPFIIDVGDDDDPNAFRIIHSELPHDWDESMLQEKLTSASKKELSENLQWSRNIITKYNVIRHHFDNDQAWLDFSNEIKSKNSRFTLSGHTPVKDALILGNQAFIDIGGKRLCCMDALTKEVYSVEALYNET